MNPLTSPHLVTICIMAMYAANCIRYALDADWWRVSYWACALGITASVTFGNFK